jgi:hypothetical protein
MVYGITLFLLWSLRCDAIVFWGCCAIGNATSELFPCVGDLTPESNICAELAGSKSIHFYLIGLLMQVGYVIQNASSSYAMVLHEWKCFSNYYQEAWEQNSTPYGFWYFIQELAVWV